MTVTQLLHKKKNSTSANEHLNIKTFGRLVCSMNYSIMLMDTAEEVMYPMKIKHAYIT